MSYLPAALGRLLGVVYEVLQGCKLLFEHLLPMQGLGQVLGQLVQLLGLDRDPWGRRVEQAATREIYIYYSWDWIVIPGLAC